MYNGGSDLKRVEHDAERASFGINFERAVSVQRQGSFNIARPVLASCRNPTQNKSSGAIAWDGAENYTLFLAACAAASKNLTEIRRGL